MKPKIPDIISAAARVCGTTAPKVLTLTLNTDRTLKGRLLTAYISMSLGYTPRQITDVTGMSEIEVRSLATRARTRISSSTRMRDLVMLMRRMLSIQEERPQQTKPLPAQHSCSLPSPEYITTGFPSYTSAEEKAMQKACLDADVFMRTYGQGEGTRPAVTDGYGYYQN